LECCHFIAHCQNRFAKWPRILSAHHRFTNGRQRERDTRRDRDKYRERDIERETQRESDRERERDRE